MYAPATPFVMSLLPLSTDGLKRAGAHREAWNAWWGSFIMTSLFAPSFCPWLMTCARIVWTLSAAKRLG